MIVAKVQEHDALGSRMKGYELACRTALPRRLPVILRFDGKAFHTYTRGMKRPVDEGFVEAMNTAAKALCEEVEGAVLAYVQSDEISVLVHNYRRLASEPWFRNEPQKMVSVGASVASVAMTLASGRIFREPRPAHFDGRAFVLPEAEVCNYFVWRQQDATRNSIQMLAQSLYSPRELHGKHTGELQELTWQKGHNWNDMPTSQKRGRCIVRETYEIAEGIVRSRWAVDNEPPIFTKDRAYIENHLGVEPEKPQGEAR